MTGRSRWIAAVHDNSIPPPGLPRRLSFQHLLTGIGTGTYITGSAVFFTEVVGLRPTEIGLGLSIGAGASLFAAVPLGTFADRHDPRLIWAISSVVQAFLYALWPFVSGFVAFVALIVTLDLLATIGVSGRTVYAIEALSPETRVRAQAFARSWLNLGWTLGAGLASVALAVGSQLAYNIFVMTNAMILLVNGLLVLRLPSVVRTHAVAIKQNRLIVFKDGRFGAVVLVCSVLACYLTIVMQVVPLWVITRTDSPRWTVSVLMALNTIIAMAGQVAATRGTETVRGAGRTLMWSGIASAACGPVFFFSGWASAVGAFSLLVLGMTLATLAEIWYAAGSWTLSVNLAPVDMRGSYQGAFRMGRSAQSMVGPAALISLALATGGWGWFVISAMFLAAAFTVPRLAGWAERSRPDLDPAPSVSAS